MFRSQAEKKNKKLYRPNAKPWLARSLKVNLCYNFKQSWNTNIESINIHNIDLKLFTRVLNLKITF